MSEELYRNAVINRNRIIEELQADVGRLKQESKDWESKYYDCRKMYGIESDKLKHDITIVRTLRRIENDYVSILKQENEDLKNDKIFAKTNIEALQNENEKLKEELEAIINYHSTAAKFIESHQRLEQENEKLKKENEMLFNDLESMYKCLP